MRRAIWLSWIVGGLGFIALLLGIQDVLAARNSLSWPTTQGRVKESFISPYVGKRNRGYLQAIVRYEYTVGAERHESRRIYFGQPYSKNAAQLRELIAPYPVGASVRVYYSPANPAEAVLQPGLHGSVFEYPLLVSGAVMVIVATIVGLVARSKRAV
jgi:hypothetical protein